MSSSASPRTPFIGSLDVDNITTSFLDDKSKLPLIISPRLDDSLEFLCHWLVANRSWVEEQILNYGAVLIRGFQVNDAPEFERAIQALQPNLSDSYRGTSPRSVFSGTKYCFSAADAPVSYPIAQHCEMSFLKSPPKQLYFGCLQESKSGGGETALCDFRSVVQQLDEPLRNKFATKKLQYRRRHYNEGEKWTTDVGSMLSWRQMFGTSDKSKVEELCRNEGAPEPRWVGQHNDTFYQEWNDEPFVRHPVTNEAVWFNHLQVFHWSTFPCELWYAFCRLRDPRFLLRSIFFWIIAIIKYVLLGHRMALDMRFGDGTDISVTEANQVRSLIHKNMVFSTWQKGDIMCIDNFSVSHGRQPTYDLGRKILVAWSEPLDKTSLAPIEEEAIVTKQSDVVFDDKLVPAALAVTPDSSPETTLTSEEAETLRDSFALNKAVQNMVRKNSFNDSSESDFAVSSHRRNKSCPVHIDEIFA
ncbi:hypothetical protein ACHAWC_010113 [Mediolabrus comicus]